MQIFCIKCFRNPDLLPQGINQNSSILALSTFIYTAHLFLINKLARSYFSATLSPENKYMQWHNENNKNCLAYCSYSCFKYQLPKAQWVYILQVNTTFEVHAAKL